ncbi:hypothetical protein GCM10022384_43150 [Streptomyces marokkonensis]|uniref:Uncharacterized protein n=1 Tax=Streptomyces marokkonensis TaxID=324855 RepID=A0ABP7R252_9ACTN
MSVVGVTAACPGVRESVPTTARPPPDRSAEGRSGERSALACFVSTASRDAGRSKRPRRARRPRRRTVQRRRRYRRRLTPPGRREGLRLLVPGAETQVLDGCREAVAHSGGTRQVAHPVRLGTRPCAPPARTA